MNLLCMQAAMHEVFEDDDMRQIFRWLSKFLNNPYSEDDQLVPAGNGAAYLLFECMTMPAAAILSSRVLHL